MSKEADAPPPMRPFRKKPSRCKKLEAALRTIRKWAENDDPSPTLKMIANKCREALATGEGE